MGLRCAQVLAGLTQALGSVASLAGLEQALAGFVARFEQMGLPGCPIGSLAAEVAERNEGAAAGRRGVRRLGAAVHVRAGTDAAAGRAARGRLPFGAGYGAAGQHRGGIVLS